jgi:hypothetical protein
MWCNAAKPLKFALAMDERRDVAPTPLKLA